MKSKRWATRISRTKARTVTAEVPELLEMANKNGFEAIGMVDVWEEGKVYLNANDPSIAASNDNLFQDAVIFRATPRAVE